MKLDLQSNQGIQSIFCHRKFVLRDTDLETWNSVVWRLKFDRAVYKCIRVISMKIKENARFLKSTVKDKVRPFKDRLHLSIAKASGQPTILFSQKEDWSHLIKSELKEYVPFFYELDEVLPSNFDLVIPLTVDAQRYLNDHPDLLTEAKVLIPSNACIDLCDDKAAFQQFLVSIGMGQFTPRTNEPFSYPYILKKKISGWGLDIFIIRDAETEQVHQEQLISSEYFTQEYIEGQEEYTTHIIFHEGQAKFFKSLKFTFGEHYFVKGKDFKETFVERVDHECFRQIFETILDKIGYQGICCFNYKLVDGEPKIFEINPRYGGSLTQFLNEAIAVYNSILCPS